MRGALRQEHKTNSQQNMVRVAENLELTQELNAVRKDNTKLAVEVTRLEAQIQV